MPVALAAFFESDSFEDAIRSAIGVGGDSDTIAAITGSIAEAYYGVPEDIWPSAHNTDRGFPAVLPAVSCNTFSLHTVHNNFSLHTVGASPFSLFVIK